MACTADPDPTNRRTRYDPTGDAPGCTGAAQDTATFPVPGRAAAATRNGALDVAAVTVTVFDLAGPVPTAVMARTVNA